MKEKIKKYYIEQGNSCAETVILCLKEENDIPDSLLYAASGLRAGIGGCGCVCGVLTAAVMGIGYISKASGDKGKTDKIVPLSKEMHNRFKDKYKNTCCRVLTEQFDFASKERKDYCAGLIEFGLQEFKNIL